MCRLILRKPSCQVQNRTIRKYAACVIRTQEAQRGMAVTLKSPTSHGFGGGNGKLNGHKKAALWKSAKLFRVVGCCFGVRSVPCREASVGRGRCQCNQRFERALEQLWCEPDSVCHRIRQKVSFLLLEPSQSQNSSEIAQAKPPCPRFDFGHLMIWLSGL